MCLVFIRIKPVSPLKDVADNIVLDYVSILYMCSRTSSATLLDKHKKVYVSGVKGVALEDLKVHFGAFGAVLDVTAHGRGVIVEFADHNGAQRVCMIEANLEVFSSCIAFHIWWCNN